MDLTVFKLEIDNPTLNAPFSGDEHTVESPSPDDSSGTPWKRRIAGVATLFVVVLGGVVVLKRRLGESESDDDLIDEPEPLDTSKETTEESDRDGIRAVIGLGFLMALTAVLGRKTDS